MRMKLRLRLMGEVRMRVKVRVRVTVRWAHVAVGRTVVGQGVDHVSKLVQREVDLLCFTCACAGACTYACTSFCASHAYM